MTNIIEAILFASGDAVDEDLIKEKLPITKIQMDAVIRQLERKYSGDCGIRLLRFNHKLQFATNPEYKEPASRVLQPIREKEFTRSILECAAIIAYKQPITRTELETIRGKNSDYAITTLLGMDMITVCGRRDTPGRPALYATTDNFLKRFKLKSLSDLPDYDELMKKISELNATDLAGTDLYARADYDSTADDGQGADDGVTSEEDLAAKAESFDLPEDVDPSDDDIIIID